MKVYISAITALIASSFGNMALAQTARKIDSSYANWYYQGRMELYNQLDNKKVDILFLGNSITERGEWQELVSGKKVSNRGIGGDNTFGVAARLDGVISQQPKKIFLLIGINDIGRGLPTDVIVSNYKRIIEKLTTSLPKTRLYIQSVLPLNEELLKYDYLKGKMTRVKELNDAIKELAVVHKLTFINLHEVFADDKGMLKKEYTADGIHLKPAAYVSWVNYLKQKHYL